MLEGGDDDTRVMVCGGANWTASHEQCYSWSSRYSIYVYHTNLSPGHQDIIIELVYLSVPTLS